MAPPHSTVFFVIGEQDAFLRRWSCTDDTFGYSIPDDPLPES